MAKAKTSVFDMLGGVDDSAAPIAQIIPLSDIRADPDQPRKTFDQGALEELAESILELGIIQPITVRPSDTVPPWIIVAGERRFRASQLAGKADIPAFIREDANGTSGDLLLMQLVENANRQDLSDFETAVALQKILELDEKSTGKKRGGRTRLAKIINRSKQTVGRYLAMLDAPAREWCEAGLVTTAEAAEFLRSAPEDVRNDLLAQARASGQPITQSAVRDAIRKAQAPAVVTPAPAAATTDVVGEGNSVNDGAGDSDQDPAGGPAAIEPWAANGGEPTTEAGAGQGNTGGQAGGDRSGGHDGDGDGDEDGDEDGEPGTSPSSLHGDAGPAGSKPATGRDSSTAPREKAAVLTITGEKIEILLRYLVDKASDRLEVKIPADLARATIENLGGEVPESTDSYGALIAELLAQR